MLFLKLVFLLLARESAKGKWDYVEEKGPVSRSMEGREEGFAGLYCIYSCLYRWLVKSWIKRESEQVNERTSPLCAGDQSLLCNPNSWRFVYG